MTPEQLKASILQYAIQGKLVEQRPEEGTGEELYRQIQAEKRRLIKAGKIKKDKPLPEIAEDEKPFDIPETWLWIRVGDVGSWGSGTTPPRTNSAYYGGSIPWLKTGDLNDGFIKEVPEFITELALEKTSVRLNPVGSILMAMYGATIGKLGILEIPVTTNQACCACIPYAGMYNKYLFYYLMSMRQTYIGMAEGGAQPNISKEKIVNSILPLPPLSEQERIVAKIEELLPYIDRYAASYERLEQVNTEFPEDMKKSVLQYAIQGKLVEQRPEECTGEELYRQIQTEKERLIKEGKIKKEKPLPEIAEDEIPFDIPESWKWVRIGALTYNWGQKTPDSRFCYIDVGSVNNTSHTLNKENTVVEAKDASSRAKKIVKKGDVIFATIRPYLKNICIIDKDFPCEPIASTAFAVMHCPEGLLNKYLYYYLLSPTFMRFANARDKAKGVAYPAIGEKDFFNGIIALPPVAEQKRIVAKLEEILPLCERLK